MGVMGDALQIFYLIIPEKNLWKIGEFVNLIISFLVQKPPTALPGDPKVRTFQVRCRFFMPHFF